MHWTWAIRTSVTQANGMLQEKRICIKSQFVGGVARRALARGRDSRAQPTIDGRWRKGRSQCGAIHGHCIYRAIIGENCKSVNAQSLSLDFRRFTHRLQWNPYYSADTSLRLHNVALFTHNKCLFSLYSDFSLQYFEAVRRSCCSLTECRSNCSSFYAGHSRFDACGLMQPGLWR